MRSWERVFSTILHRLGLDRIKSRVLAFALVATLIPTLVTGWQAYVLNKRSATAKIGEELRNATSQTVRELNLWLRERFYEMRVFSSSYEVTENLEAIARASAAGPTDEPRRRLRDYLRSVKGKFVDYEELVVIAPGAGVLFTSDGGGSARGMSPDWAALAKVNTPTVGAASWDQKRDKGLLVLAVPVKAAHDRVLGVMAAKLNFSTIEKILKGFSPGDAGQVHLVGRDGTVLVSSWPPASARMRTRVPAKTVRTLFDGEDVSLEYDDYQGRPVIGTLKLVPTLGWGAVAEVRREEAYGQIVRIRNLTLLLVGGLLVGIGVIAYLLALTVVRPLDRLTGAAARVAAGDFDVHLPVIDRGEVGYLTEIFNHMVTHLRQGRDQLAAINAALSARNRELHELTVRDGLTGLYNRKHLGKALTTEVARAGRFKHSLSVMMIDLDQFKRYNDTYGHPAGDHLLVRVAGLFRESTRSIDYVARYGGEEFLIMLPEVGPEGGLEAAERIRARVAAEPFGEGSEPVRVTISIGVAVFPEHGDTPDALIASADAALYEAKRGGRNRVILAGADQNTR